MSYIWRTMEDEKVRKEHAARNGLVFDDNYRPEPGEEYNCRCVREYTPEEDNDDDPTSLPSINPFEQNKLSTSTDTNVFGGFAKAASLSIGISIGIKGFNNFLEPALGSTSFGKYVNKLAPSVGSFLSKNKVGLGFAVVGLFSDNGKSTTENLANSAIGLGLGIAASRLGPLGAFVFPAVTAVKGLLSGESLSQVALSIAGDYTGRAIGGSIGNKIFKPKSIESSKPIIQSKYTEVHGTKPEIGMFDLRVTPTTDINTIKTKQLNAKSARSRNAPVMEKRLGILAEALRNKNKGKVF